MAKVGKKLKAILGEVLRLREDDQRLLEEISSLRDDNSAVMGEISLLRGENNALTEEISKLLQSDHGGKAVPNVRPDDSPDYDALRQEMRNLSREYQKHDLAIADMLDTWEEWRAAGEKEKDESQTALLRKSREELIALQDRENAMTTALVCCLDQLFVLEQAADAAGDAAWLRQLILAESAVREKCLVTGLQVIGEKGDPFSYEQHEPVEKIDANRPDQHMTIARVISRGYWMRGKRLRKAQVSVYISKEEMEA